MKDTETTEVRFYYNGIRINGSNELQKFIYSNSFSTLSKEKIENQDIAMEATPFWDSKHSYMKDIFEWDDRSDQGIKIPKTHPLHRFASYGLAQARIKRTQDYIKYNEKLITRYEKTNPMMANDSRRNIEESNNLIKDLSKIKNPGHPKKEDIEKAKEYIANIKNQQKAIEEEKQREREEAYKNLVTKISKIAENSQSQFPYEEDDVKVVFGFSENRGIPINIPFSLKGADVLLNEANSLTRHDKGYYKTDFKISFGRGENSVSYSGRFDIGSESKGLLTHIKEVKEYYSDAGKFLDKLNSFIKKRKASLPQKEKTEQPIAQMQNKRSR